MLPLHFGSSVALTAVLGVLLLRIGDVRWFVWDGILPSMCVGLAGAGVELVVGLVGSSGKLWYTYFITAVSIKVSTPCFSVWRLLCKSVAADCVGLLN